MNEHDPKDPEVDLTQWRRRVHDVDSSVHELREHVAHEHEVHDGKHHLVDVLLHHHHSEDLHGTEGNTA